MSVTLTLQTYTGTIYTDADNWAFDSHYDSSSHFEYYFINLDDNNEYDIHAGSDISTSIYVYSGVDTSLPNLGLTYDQGITGNAFIDDWTPPSDGTYTIAVFHEASSSNSYNYVSVYEDVQSTTTTSSSGYVYGSSSAELLTGSSGDDIMRAYSGLDTISSGAGSDIVYGNLGSDLIIGGDGSDTLYGGQNDGPAGSDGLSREGTETISGGAGSDIIYGNMGGDRVLGGTGADMIFGGQDSDTLSGGSDNDYLYGNLGNDVLSGGSGADTFAPGAGADQITDFSVADSDRIQLSGSLSSQFQSGDNAVVTTSSGNTVTIVGVNIADLSDSVFI